MLRIFALMLYKLYNHHFLGIFLGNFRAGIKNASFTDGSKSLKAIENLIKRLDSTHYLL